MAVGLLVIVLLVVGLFALVFLGGIAMAIFARQPVVKVIGVVASISVLPVLLLIPAGLWVSVDASSSSRPLPSRPIIVPADDASGDESVTTEVGVRTTPPPTKSVQSESGASGTAEVPEAE